MYIIDIKALKREDKLEELYKGEIMSGIWVNFYKMPRNVQLLVRCCCGGRAWKCVVTTQEDLVFFNYYYFVICYFVIRLLYLQHCVRWIHCAHTTLLFSTLASWEASPLGWKWRGGVEGVGRGNFEVHYLKVIWRTRWLWYCDKAPLWKLLLSCQNATI